MIYDVANPKEVDLISKIIPEKSLIKAEELEASLAKIESDEINQKLRIVDEKGVLYSKTSSIWNLFRSEGEQKIPTEKLRAPSAGLAYYYALINLIDDSSKFTLFSK
jgi:hypothetical protein